MKIISAMMAVAATIFFTAVDIFAQTGISDSTSAPMDKMYSPSLFGIMVKLVISLFFIIGLIYFSTFFMKKLNSRATGRGGMGDTIKVMGRTFLSPKQSLYLVKIGQKYAVLGVSDQSINKISELTEEEVARIDGRGLSPDSASTKGKFSEIFKGMLRR